MLNNKRKTGNWKLIKTFDDEQDFQKNFNRQQFRIEKREYLKSGNTTIFKCTIVKTCNFLIKIKYISLSEKVQMYHNSIGHCHTQMIEYNKFPKELINEFVDINNILKPQIIQKCVYDKYNVIVSSKQISNYIQRIKGESTSKSTNILDIIDFCKIHSTPTSDDDSFVTSYEINANTFKISFSTVNLLGCLRFSSSISLDGTYKLNWSGYPLIVMGVNDKGKRFHPVIFLLSNSETTADYNYIFKEVVDKYQFFYGLPPVISDIISDGSRTIAASCDQFFGVNIRRRTCFFHFKKNISKLLKRIKDEKLLSRITFDIYILQLSSSDVIFECVIEKLFDKYENSTTQVKELFSYIKNNWLGEFKYWYEGADRRAPSTNNGIESFNRKIKDTGTLRCRLPLLQFLSKMGSFLKFTSVNTYNGMQNEIITNTPISNQLWVEGIKFYKKIKSMLILDRNEYIFRLSDSTFIERPLTFDSFDEYKEFIQNHILLEVAGRDCFCSCKGHLKDYICCHSLGLSVLLGFIDPPFNPDMFELPPARCCGRPSLATPALQL